MVFPEPKPGLVVRYSYLWRREADRGREEGAKDRPCLVVLTVKVEGAALRVRVAPITHSPPQRSEDAIELPQATKRRLGLDEDRSWISTLETNSFIWPGPDLKGADENGDRAVFGFVSGGTFRKTRDAIVDNIKKHRTRDVKRTE